MVSYSPVEIKEKYSKIASRYDMLEALPELLGLARIRNALFQKAEGNVLEVAAGTGKNFPNYKKSVALTAVDISPDMLAEAEKKATKYKLNARFLLMDAHALDFPDRSFDTVTSSMSVCTFKDPVKAVNEMIRVCRPGGWILLLEHGKSSKKWINRFLDKKAAAHAQVLGCHWNRDIPHVLAHTNMDIISHKDYFFGIFHSIEANPKAS